MSIVITKTIVYALLALAVAAGVLVWRVTA